MEMAGNFAVRDRRRLPPAYLGSAFLRGLFSYPDRGEPLADSHSIESLTFPLPSQGSRLKYSTEAGTKTRVSCVETSVHFEPPSYVSTSQGLGGKKSWYS